MRLLNTTTLELHDFSSAEVPPYAILSHTWGDGEVTFQEMSSITRTSKKGFGKIKKTCDLARRNGIKYAWLDTCCIDKSSSAELSEAINSMYQWYSEADECYVYLEDLPPGGTPKEGMPNCRWFTRGWTLQELLAPRKPWNVSFYDGTWNHRGTMEDHIDVLSKCTGIPEAVLLTRVTIAECSVAQRMSWAARRKTTRIEDTAYCLLGIFNVNMPLLYGEGKKAFRRLQEEIIKQHNDLTIFAWEDPAQAHYAIRLFTEAPSAFVNSSMIVPFKSDFAEFSVTNKGLLVSGDVPLRVVTKTTELGRFARFALFLGTTSSQEDSSGGIYLRKLGPKLFIRDLALPLAGFRDSTFNMMYTLEDVPNYFILMDPKSYSSDIVAFWDGAIHIPVHETLKLADAVPETLWEVASRVFLKPKHYSWTRYPAVLAMDFRGTVLGQTMEVVVLCHYTEGDLSPKCKAFWRGSYPREEAMIFEQRSNRNESIFWSQFEVDSPDILQRSHKVERRRAKKVLGISAWFEKGIVPSITSEVEIFSLKLVITVKDTAGIEIEVE